MKRSGKTWTIAILLIVVVLVGGFFTVFFYVRSTQAWARALALPEPSLVAVADGVYEGTSHLRLPAGTAAANSSATVRVTVKDHRYTAVEVLAPKAIASSMTDFAQIVITRQTTHLDGLSGATVTKAAVLLAVANAVSQKSRSSPRKRSAADR